MKFETFELERNQSTWENQVKYNLSESGVHPISLKELLSEKELEELMSERLHYPQTNGSDELRKAISSLYLGATTANVLVTNGSAEANLISILSVLEPGDELIFMIPNYMQIWGLARGFGIVVKPIMLKEELNWQLDVNELKKLVSTKTKMIAICNPNNPTGAIMDSEIMEVIQTIAREADAWILSDEVYRGAELEDDESPSMFTGHEKDIVNAGLSKSYSLPGLRIGWTVGSKEYVSRAWGMHDYTSIGVGLLSDKVATKALQPEMRRKILGRTKTVIRENLDVVKEWVGSHDGLLSFVPPKAGAIVFIRYNLKITSAELVERLREEKSVFLVAGEWFGMDNYIRIGFGCPKDYLMEGLALFDELLYELTCNPSVMVGKGN